MTALAEKLPTLVAALRVDAGGEKRNRVLRAIAAYLDEGREPSLREIAERAQLEKGWKTAEALIRRLEADGLVRVEWARTTRAERRRLRAAGERFPRNTYELLLP